MTSIIHGLKKPLKKNTQKRKTINKYVTIFKKIDTVSVHECQVDDYLLYNTYLNTITVALILGYSLYHTDNIN